MTATTTPETRRSMIELVLYSLSLRFLGFEEQLAGLDPATAPGFRINGLTRTG